MKPRLMAIINAILTAGRDGISAEQIGVLLEIPKKSLASDLRLIDRKRFGISVVGSGPAALWVVTEWADSLRQRRDREARDRLRAYWARKQREVRAGQREAQKNAPAAILAPRRPRFVAGSIPPPVTFAPRTVFEYRGGAL